MISDLRGHLNSQTLSEMFMAQDFNRCNEPQVIINNITLLDYFAILDRMTLSSKMPFPWLCLSVFIDKALKRNNAHSEICILWLAFNKSKNNNDK